MFPILTLDTVVENLIWKWASFTLWQWQHVEKTDTPTAINHLMRNPTVWRGERQTNQGWYLWAEPSASVVCICTLQMQQFSFCYAGTSQTTSPAHLQTQWSHFPSTFPSIILSIQRPEGLKSPFLKTRGNLTTSCKVFDINSSFIVHYQTVSPGLYLRFLSLQYNVVFG